MDRRCPKCGSTHIKVFLNKPKEDAYECEDCGIKGSLDETDMED